MHHEKPDLLIKNNDVAVKAQRRDNNPLEQPLDSEQRPSQNPEAFQRPGQSDACGFKVSKDEAKKKALDMYINFTSL